MHQQVIDLNSIHRANNNHSREKKQHEFGLKVYDETNLPLEMIVEPKLKQSVSPYKASYQEDKSRNTDKLFQTQESRQTTYKKQSDAKRVMGR